MKENKRRKTFYERFFKRFFDFTLSFTALIILSPVYLSLYIASKISLGGKAIFAQYRPGKNGKLFKMYKFRSMTDAIDEKGNLLPDEERITKFGKFIRKTSLDELPQLWNIVKGDMSIIGPRPRLVKDMVFYDESTFPAYSVRPGLTGLSQIHGGRSESDWNEIFKDDIAYSEKITFFKDVKILFQTVGALFKSDSSSEGASSSKREYYYADYLLKSGLITQSQYALGLATAQEIIASQGKVEYQPALHNGLTRRNPTKHTRDISTSVKDFSSKNNSYSPVEENEIIS